jgi:hypothetical protein
MLYLNTPSINSCLNVGDRVSQLYSTTGDIIASYNLILKFLKTIREDGSI